MSISNYFKPKPNANNPRAPRVKIAEETLEVIKKGSYTHNGTVYTLKDKVEALKRGTRYYAGDSLLSNWRHSPSAVAAAGGEKERSTSVSILEMTTLEGARYLSKNTTTPQTIGVLNFASAKKPGGGFLTGAQAQEESIARSSTLYPSLMTDIAQNFYNYHLKPKQKKNFFYSHAMIYSPGVVVFRDDEGKWADPLEVDILTSAAVNAGEVRKNTPSDAEAEAERKIEREMKERMARVLYLFEMRGTKDLVLGSFGTGVFQNRVDMVARLWAELLSTRFQTSFDKVVFAIIGRRTFDEFQEYFNEHHSTQTVQSQS
ncbi:hypothetical protein Moror_17844 [Moniliophthora roreri MCA 2997]|uniref:Microbial-type PARG catalytic domain-containing protein n=1 Tax=Moniliophthora roreri (strain MCA 2997) TaxID=1381753 RepID=V2YZZ4_MONRO|nr:hypothetical protein Moror_17844 [Moniliophthora roreri MCA 2997]